MPPRLRKSTLSTGRKGSSVGLYIFRLKFSNMNPVAFNHTPTLSNKAIIMAIIIIIINSKEQQSRGGQTRWTELERNILQGAVTVK